MVAMLTRGVCTLLCDYDLISDYDLRVLLAVIADYDLRAYKYVSPTLLAKHHKLGKQGTGRAGVVSSLKRLVKSNFLQFGPRMRIHNTAKRGDYRSGYKYATYRLNPAITLASIKTAQYLKFHAQREQRMELSPLTP